MLLSMSAYAPHVRMYVFCHTLAGGVGPKEFLAGVDYLEVKCEPQVSVWQRDLNDRMHSPRTTAAALVIGKRNH
jgi:hypothetical protein